MSKKMSIYEKAYNNCVKKGLINSNCDKFLKLDFTMKLKKCKTPKCKKYYRSKLRKLSKKVSKKKSKKKSVMKKSFLNKKSNKKSIKKKKSIKRSKKNDGEFPSIKKYKRCYAFKGFW